MLPARGTRCAVPAFYLHQDQNVSEHIFPGAVDQYAMAQDWAERWADKPKHPDPTPTPPQPALHATYSYAPCHLSSPARK